MSAKILVPVHSVRINFESSNVGTGAYVELEDSMTKPCSYMTIFYTGEAVLKLATGAVSTESDIPVLIPPGGIPGVLVPINISGSARVSIKAVDKTANMGELILNFFG